ncbi:hypothetical protein LSAT2_002514 [Lamellibrachia satsuma]|nr:hypothetical protein LSAT2_002514 [Lamellibrachia satsuma]
MANTKTTKHVAAYLSSFVDPNICDNFYDYPKPNSTIKYRFVLCPTPDLNGTFNWCCGDRYQQKCCNYHSHYHLLWKHRYDYNSVYRRLDTAGFLLLRIWCLLRRSPVQETTLCGHSLDQAQLVTVKLRYRCITPTNIFQPRLTSRRLLPFFRPTMRSRRSTVRLTPPYSRSNKSATRSHKYKGLETINRRNPVIRQTD